MFFPYATDAPVYHLPLATAGLIAANVAVFVAVATGAVEVDPATGAPWALTYGEGLRPTEWLTSPFLHAGPGHLLGNMVSLWVFGLVVEGKLGALRFLPIYLAIAAGESALEQTLMLGRTEGSSLGASAAIYGLLAIAAVWAPENDARFFYWLGLYVGTVELPLATVAAVYVGWDLATAALAGGLLGVGVTSGLLHLLGFAVGAPIGVLLLKRGVVDCEGWDLFTRYFSPPKSEPKRDPLKEVEAERVERSLHDSQTLVRAREQVAAYLRASNQRAAATLYQKMRGVGEGLRLDTQTLHGVAAGLQEAEQWPDLAAALDDLARLAPESADPVRVRLAHLCVTKLERPGRALELLAAARPDRLSEAGRRLAQQVEQRARAMQRAGVVELDDGGW